MEIKTVADPDEKQRVAQTVLVALPDWFGVPAERDKYVRESAGLPFFAAYDDDRPVGFLCLKETGRDTIEIHVMGLLKEYHRKGLGRRLFKAARESACQQGYSFLQVKTVQMGHYDDYDQTNRFYRALGFKEFEVFPLFWDEDNPCQVYVMSLA